MDIRQLVVSEVSALSEVEPSELRLEHTLLGDAKMDADDFSYLFVPRLEKALGLRFSQSDWAGIRTVGEVVQMLERKSKEAR